jgi:FkbM family methyltransferase
MYVHGIYEQRTTAIFTSLVREGMTVLDAGAYIGIYSLLAAKRVGPSGRVVAVEPNPDSHARLCRNLALNHFDNVTVLPVALSSTGGKARLNIPINDSPSASLRSLTVPTVEVVVSVDTIDSLVRRLQVTALGLMKADVEGMEERVFRGGLETLRKWHPAIVFEANDFLWDQSKVSIAAVDILRSLGYRIYGISPYGRRDLRLVELMPDDDPRPYREPGMSLNLVALHPERME